MADTASFGDDTGGGSSVATVIRLDRSADGAPEAPGTTGEPGEDPPDAAVPGVLVDQRMRRRRIAVRREAGRRRLVRLLWVLVPVAVVVDGAALVHVPMLDVDHITIEGTQQTPAATVAWASRIDVGDTLATLDEHGAERRVERLPWVADADVIRQWPATVRIVVSERVPAAVIPGDPERGTPPAVVDRDARVLNIGGDVPFGLVTLTGVGSRLSEGGTLPSSAVPALDLGVQLNERFPGAATTVGLDLDATLSSGGVVRFGSLDQLEDKLVALEGFLSDVDLSNLAVLDLRVPSSPAVRRHG